MQNLAVNFERVQERIAAACSAAGRRREEVKLIAVSKRHTAAAIEMIADLGQEHFGENYVNEALEKQEQLAHRNLQWHYIGPIQSNKTAAIATHFQWVHSVDRVKILRRLNEHTAAEDGRKLNVLLQVHIGDETSKSGVDPEELAELAETADQMNNLRVRGLMCIPPPAEDAAVQRRYCAELREYFEALGPKFGWDHLSMGMSNDLEAAVAEGATMVRVGTDIFGPRP